MTRGERRKKKEEKKKEEKNKGAWGRVTREERRKK